MKIKNFPNFRQTYEYDCGSQALQAVLAYYGIDVSGGEIMKLAGTAEHGTFPESIVSTAQHHGLKALFKKMTLHEVKRSIDKGIPVILLLQAWTPRNSDSVDWTKNWDDGHYAVVIGYDRTKVYFEDPNSIFRTFLTYKQLADRWHDTDGYVNYVNYGIMIYGKKPDYHPERIIHMD